MTRLLKTGMKGTLVEYVASSWMEALPGLSRWYIRKVPPCFGSAAGATLESASKDTIAAASAGTLRMLPSLEVSASCGPIYRTIAWRGGRATTKAAGNICTSEECKGRGGRDRRQCGRGRTARA